MIHWKKRRERQYDVRNPRPQYIATVFAAPRGYDWAWAVWYEGGCDSGVELTFRGAKHRAEEVIERLVGEPRTGDKS